MAVVESVEVGRGGGGIRRVPTPQTLLISPATSSRGSPAPSSGLSAIQSRCHGDGYPTQEVQCSPCASLPGASLHGGRRSSSGVADGTRAVYRALIGPCGHPSLANRPSGGVVGVCNGVTDAASPLSRDR